MRRGTKRAFKAFVILFSFAWLYTKMFWPSTFTDAPEVLANLYAKELCTCRYIIGQSVERCYENHENITRPGSLVWNEAERSVRVRVFWATSEAKVASDRFGCVRTNFDSRRVH